MALSSTCTGKTGQTLHLQASDSSVTQAITNQIERGDVNFNIVRVVTDAAAVAVQKPAKLFVPILAASNLLRTATLALEIAADSDLLSNLHWIASAPLICPAAAV